MRVFSSIVLSILLASQAGGLAPLCMPCGMQAMAMPSCHAQATEGADNFGLVAKCCCSMRQATDAFGDYAVVQWVDFSRLGIVDAFVPSLSGNRYLKSSARADAHLLGKQSGAPPALFLLNNSYLI